jgi:prolyl oligopeptidase
MAIERTTVLLLIVAATLGTLADAAEIPSPPVRNVIDTYYGVPVEDPYRYMEDINQPEVSTWMRAQADRTDALLKSIPGGGRSSSIA